MLGDITILQSMDYVSVDEVIEKGYINSPYGAFCTMLLKKRVRQDWEKANWAKGPLVYIWGFDASESRRADRVVESMPEFGHEFPLIERGLTKADCHAICDEWGIRRPEMYDLGYPNNNCVGCVKGGMGYWNKIREDFPAVFKRRSRQEREIGHSCINGVFLDELEPGRGRDNPVVPDCSLDCAMALSEQEEP